MHAGADRVTENRAKAAEGLILATILALAFLCLSLVRILGDAGSALFNGEVRIAPLEQSVWKMRLGFRLVEFGASLVMIHILLACLAWVMALLSRRAWPDSRNSQRAWTGLWMVVMLVWILVANAQWFPSSSLGSEYAALVRISAFGISIFDIATILLGGAVCLTVCRAVWRWRSGRTVPRAAIAVCVGIVLIGALFAATPGPGAWMEKKPGVRPPNIILVGLDSVRTDVVDGAARGTSAPSLNAFLRESTVFSDTTTPLARTFAAWVSILTGRHPHTTGATVNLLPRELIHTGETLPDVLRAAGYETVYGIDEVRFSNIDESYGFDRIIGPRIGSADFLIEFFGDTPLSNLVVNTRLGDVLFPELHGNRAAEAVYNPDTFLRDLERTLSFDSPTFLAVHLTLAHWPYSWADSDPADRVKLEQNKLPELYDAAIGRLDRQFADLIAMLGRKGALEDAIVVVLSDHGESLGELSPLAREGGELSPLLGKSSIYGHGTHVFSDDQYQVLLAMRSYGDAGLESKPGTRITEPASLEDIAPTLVEALGLSSADPFDGRSLMPYLGEGAHDYSGEPKPRIRYLETEFNPPGIAVEEPMTASAVARASASYRIDSKTDRVEVRPEQLDRILETRQYAAVLGDHVLASVPASRSDRQHLVYVDPGSDGPVWLDAPPGVGSTPVQRQLWTALRNRYQSVAARPVVPPPPVAD